MVNHNLFKKINLIRRKRNNSIKKRYNKLIIKKNIKLNNLERENNELKLNFDKIQTEIIFEKFVIAIQDLNKLDKLESKNLNIKLNLKNLHKYRINKCHYLDYKYSCDQINNRKIVLYNKISTIDKKINDLFEKRYPDLLNNILPLIKLNNKIIPTNEINDINEWWSV